MGPGLALPAALHAGGRGVRRQGHLALEEAALAGEERVRRAADAAAGFAHLFPDVFLFPGAALHLEGLAGLGPALSLAAGVSSGHGRALPGERLLVVVEPGAGVAGRAGLHLLPRQEVLHLGVRLRGAGGDAGGHLAALLAERRGEYEEGAAAVHRHRPRRPRPPARGGGGVGERGGDRGGNSSRKGVGNTKKERQLYIVTGFAAVATVLVAAGYDFGVAGLRLSALYSYTVDLFLIAIIPVALYAFLGGKIFCRYWCPVVGWMNLVGAKTSRFRISADKHRCITCNLCSRYCEVGVDVMKFAVKGEAFGLWNSSCIGCGVCIHVCPTDVLTFGHHQLVTLPTAPPLRKAGSSLRSR